MSIKKLKKLAWILLGNLCVAVAIVFFVVPAGFITGGATGIALLLEQYLHLPISYGVGILCLLLLAVGYLSLGKSFAATTALSAVTYPICVWLCELVAGRINWSTDSKVLNLACAVLFFGYGVAAVLRQGASTGGLDVIAMILHKKRGMSLAAAVALFEVLSMATQVGYSTTEEILGGILLTVFYTAVMNHFIARGTARVQVMIYSAKYEQINEYINKELNRGSTLFHVQGGYSRVQGYALQTILSYRELFELKEMVLKMDEAAFMTVSEMSEVSGNGFTRDQVMGPSEPK